MPSQKRFTINGLIDTNRTALENIEEITNSAGAWFTFNNVTGLWSVIINRSGTSVASFNDSNIIGGIRVNGLGMNELYNAVRVTYHRNDIRDNQDFVQIALPESELNPNEVSNILDITLPLVNNQVQAQLIGLRDLKQSRVNQVINFDADYSAMNLQSGDIIDVTSSILGLDQTLYRVTEIIEYDNSERGIYFSITAVVFDASVYDESDLKQFSITTENGLITAGDIGVPLTPQVTKVELSSRPRLSIEVQVPSGRVEAMEVWLAEDQPTNNYTLVGTLTNTDTNVLSEDDELVLDLDNINAADVYVKTRGINSTTAGPFSAVSPLISFVPVQATDAVVQNTNVLDQNGDSLLGLLGANALIAAVKKLLEDNDPAAGSIFAKTFEVFDQETGTVLQDVTYSETFNSEVDISTTVTKLTAMSATANNNYVYNTNNTNNRNNWIVAPSLTLPETYSAVNVDIRTPTCEMSYDFLDQNDVERTATIFAQPAFSIRVLFNPAGAAPNLFTATELEVSTVDWTSNFARVSLTRDLNVGPFLPAGTYWVALQLIPSYDLNMHWPVRDGASVVPQHIYFYDFLVFSGTTFTLTGLRAPQ